MRICVLAVEVSAGGPGSFKTILNDDRGQNRLACISQFYKPIRLSDDVPAPGIPYIHSFGHLGIAI
jgi:hypothetical protein